MQIPRCCKCGASRHSGTLATSQSNRRQRMRQQDPQKREPASSVPNIAASICRGHARTAGPLLETTALELHGRRRLRQHDPQKRYELRVSRTQVHQLQRHARTEGPQPKRLPSDGYHDMRRMRRNRPQRIAHSNMRPMWRNRPQREQMPHSSAQCMWPSRLTSYQPAICVLKHVCTLCGGEEEPKGHNNTICPTRLKRRTCKLLGRISRKTAAYGKLFGRRGRLV